MPVRLRSVSRQTSRAQRLEAVGLALLERRGGEQRGRDRLQRQRDAQLLDHVGLVLEVEVHLDGRGPVHHVEAVRADRRHVARHHAVALLRHLRRVRERPIGREAERRGSRARACRRPPSPDRDAAQSRPRPRAASTAAAPDNSNWPPGSSEIVSPPSPSGRFSAMICGPSVIGCQPKRSIRPSINARMPLGPA